MKKTFVDRFRKTLDLRGISQSELSKKTGIRASSISDYYNGRYIPKQDKVTLIANVLDVSPSWLLCVAEDESEVQKDDASDNKYKSFPISISAGYLEDIEGTNTYDLITIADEIMGKYAGQKNIILLKVNGESMNKIIPNGSFIIVDTNKTRVTDIYDRDIIVFANGGEGYSIKRYINDSKNKRFLFKPESTDETFTAKEIKYEDSDNLKLIGKVVKYIVDLD